MPKLDHTGPQSIGEKSGRELGDCENTVKSLSDKLNQLGKGLGLRRKSGGGVGKGKRLKSGIPGRFSQQSECGESTRYKSQNQKNKK